MRFDSSGGYRTLDSWVLASIAQLATHRFCKKFLTRDLDPTGRQYDQMTQAARSGKANLVEGSARSATSKETEMKLTDVARASLAELQSDYETWLLRQNLVPWHRDSPEARAVFAVRLDHPDYGNDFLHDSCAHILAQQKKFAQWLDSENPAIIANALLIILTRAIRTLMRQMETQRETFAARGGFREKLTAIRVDARARQENAPACPECGAPMKRRQAQTGPNAGHPFWGCTAYPACKTIRPIPDKQPLPSPSSP
ncbi:MAG: four helix bundle suffix domain-containing protein [Opitutaceae bacterium]|jgi:four helix bundle suffix protein|nr:four helix bundle suffix domain-containing protein [Opitutaceae bacterium]